MTDAARPTGTLGERIARARLRLGAVRGKAMTQTELARSVGVTPATVSQWEAGASTPPLDTIQRIAGELGVTAGWLAFGETNQPASDETGRFSAEKWIDVTAQAEAALAAEEEAPASTTARRKNGGRKR